MRCSGDFDLCLVSDSVAYRCGLQKTVFSRWYLVFSEEKIKKGTRCKIRDVKMVSHCKLR